jgi:hypothetical protein
MVTATRELHDLHKIPQFLLAEETHYSLTILARI